MRNANCSTIPYLREWMSTFCSVSASMRSRAELSGPNVVNRDLTKVDFLRAKVNKENAKTARHNK
jgi:hypothetical protein